MFHKNYFDYYKTPRGFHPRSGNSTDGWTVIMPEFFINFPLLYRAGDIRNAVMLVHGDKAQIEVFIRKHLSLGD